MLLLGNTFNLAKNPKPRSRFQAASWERRSLPNIFSATKDSTEDTSLNTEVPGNPEFLIAGMIFNFSIKGKKIKGAAPFSVENSSETSSKGADGGASILAGSFMASRSCLVRLGKGAKPSLFSILSIASREMDLPWATNAALISTME